MNGPLDIPYYGDKPEDTGPEPLANIEAEQSVLGSILMQNECFWNVDGWLQANHFYDPLHQRLFTVISNLIRKEKIADPVTLKPWFADDETMIEFGGIGYLANLASASVSLINVADYARNIVDYALRRHLEQSSVEIAGLARSSDIDAAEAVSLAETALSTVVDDNHSDVNIRSMATLVEDTLKAATEAAQRDEGIIGIPTGLNKLDKILGGLRPGNFIVLGGRPGMGKSALGLVIGLNAAKHSINTEAGYGVAILTLEMEGEEMTFRAFSAGATRHNTWHPYSEMMRGIFDSDQMDAMGAASRDLADLPVYIEDTGRKTVSSMRAITRQIDRSFKKEGRRLGLLIVDHMGIALADKAYHGFKVAEMTQISNDLKSMAKQLQIPVLALHQLSRAVESRDNKRPVLSDLRDSGSIEQDADVVLFAYRDAYYKKKEEPEFGTHEHGDWKLELVEVEHDIEIIIAKNRHGPEGKVKFYCDIGCNVILDENPGRFARQGSFEIGQEGLL